MKYKIKKGLIFKKKGKKISIFDPEKSAIYELNEIGSFILNKIRKGSDKDNILNTLVNKYHQTKEKLYKDNTIFLKKLRKLKIIT